jgi:hypothetical protein
MGISEVIKHNPAGWMYPKAVKRIAYSNKKFDLVHLKVH